MKKIGTHLILDAWNAPQELLNNSTLIKQTLIEAAKVGEVEIVDISVHEFSPQGVTATATLVESHIAIHTWPEYGYFAVDLFFCGQGKPTEAIAIFPTALKAVETTIKQIDRGFVE